MSSNRELYEILEVKIGASFDEVRRSYKRLVLVHHPDKGGCPEKFKRINSAYTTLKNIHEGTYSNTHIDKRFFDIDPMNLFNFFFPSTNSKKNLNIEKILFVSLEDIFQEKEKTLSFWRKIFPCNCSEKCKMCFGKGIQIVNTKNKISLFNTCKGCKGKGNLPRKVECSDCDENGVKRELETINVHINAINVFRKHIVFPEKGSVEKNIKGDLIVKLEIIKNTNFTIEGINLWYNMEISLKEALCGFSKKFLHPSGKYIEVKHPGVLNGEEYYRSIGEGFICGKDKGDLFIKFSIKFPENLNDDQKRKIKEIL